MFHLHIIKPLRHTGKWQHRVREWKQKSIKYKEGAEKATHYAITIFKAARFVSGNLSIRLIQH